MGELGEQQTSLLNNLIPEDKTSGGLEQRQSNDILCNDNLSLQTTSFESHWLQGSKATSGLAPEDPEEEIPPEEVAGEELPTVPSLNDTLRQDLEEDVVEMRWVLVPSGWVGAGRRQMLTHRGSALAIFIVLPCRDSPHQLPKGRGAVGGSVLLWVLAHSSQSGNTREGSEHCVRSPKGLRRWSWLLLVPWTQGSVSRLCGA